jgi:hypothetical protein
MYLLALRRKLLGRKYCGRPRVERRQLYPVLSRPASCWGTSGSATSRVLRNTTLQAVTGGAVWRRGSARNGWTMWYGIPARVELKFLAAAYAFARTTSKWEIYEIPPSVTPAICPSWNIPWVASALHIDAVSAEGAPNTPSLLSV